MRVQKRGPSTEYYAIFSAIIVFAAGWALSIILVEEGSFTDIPRWKSTLWYYLTNHGIPLSGEYSRDISVGSTQPLLATDVVRFIEYIPILATTVAGGYTSYQYSTRRIQKNVSEALTAGSAYFLVAVGGLILSDMQPAISSLLLIGGVIAAAAWIGSSFIGTFMRNIPIIGVASLGTILALGFILVAGGAAILSLLWELLAISYVGAGLGGAAIGIDRTVRYRGKRHSSKYPRLTGAKVWLEESWTKLVVVLTVGILLYAAVTGAI